MFDTQSYDSLRENAERVAAARTEMGLATGAQAREALRTVQRVQDTLDGVHAALLSRIEESESYADDGASSTTAWARQELRMPSGEARKRRRAGETLRALPDVASALASGKIRLAHVYEFTCGITKLGADVMFDAQDILLPVAESCDPMVLRELITELHAVLYPDDLDDKYAKGMNRRDIMAAKCGSGWHVSGFLDAVAGAKFHEFLKSVSAPACESDDRAPSDRRVDGLEQLLDNAGNSGNADNDPPDASASGASAEPASGEPTSGESVPDDPAPRGRRRASTQLLVLADLETLLRWPGARPAMLAGYGHIGAKLLSYLTCGADLSGILTHGFTTGPVPQANVLNVGRASRLATTAQRRAVAARQEGTCAAPGCQLTRLDIHHVAYWQRDGGPTDLSNLIGLCNRCHHLVHQGKLVIDADGAGGFTFARQTGRIIDDHDRLTRRRVRDALARLRRILHEERVDDQPGSRAAAPSPDNGETEQTRRLRAHGIRVHRIAYRELSTADPPNFAG